MSDTTNLPIEKNDENLPLELGKLTDQNWLFIECYLKTGKIIESHKFAGYEGGRNSAYELFKRLKPAIGEILKANGFSIERLQSQLGELEGLPLMRTEETGVTVKERLKILELKAKILNATKGENKPQLSVFIVNRASGHSPNGQEGNNPPQLNPEIIDAQELK